MMAIFTANSLNEAMKPLTIISKILGILPLIFQPPLLVESSGYPQITKYCSKAWIVNALYALVIVCVLLYQGYLILTSKLKNLYKEFKCRCLLTDEISMILLFLCTSVALMQGLLSKRNTWNEVMRRIQCMDSKFQTYVSRFSYDKIYAQILFQLAGVLLIFGVLAYLDYQAFANILSFNLLFAGFLLNFMRMIMDLQFINLNLALRQTLLTFNRHVITAFGFNSDKDLCRTLLEGNYNIEEENSNVFDRFYAFLFKILWNESTNSQQYLKNDKIKDFKLRRRFHNIHSIVCDERIRKFRIDHVEICSIQKTINDYYQMYILLEFLSTGAETVLILYIGTLNGTKYRIQMIRCFAWLALNILKFVFVTGSCGAVINVDKTFSIIISKLLNISELLQPRVKTELYKFSQQLLYTKIKFTAKHFFSIDTALLGGILKTVIIYVVILLQSQSIYEKKGVSN